MLLDIFIIFISLSEKWVYKYQNAVFSFSKITKAIFK